MRQENAGAEKCNERGGQLKHGNLPYAEMRAVTGTYLKALRFRMVSSPWKNGFVAAIPPLSYFWEVCVAAGTHGRDTWPGHMAGTHGPRPIARHGQSTCTGCAATKRVETSSVRLLQV